MGRDFAQYVTEPDKASKYIHQAFERGAATDLPLTVRHRDGSLTDVLCNASTHRDINGRVLCMLATGATSPNRRRSSRPPGA